MAAKVQPKHKVQGDPLPSLEKGVTRLYSFRFCPYSHKARLVLAAKGINYELVNIDIRQKPDWYVTKNPLGSTPCYERDDKIVHDSVIICEYLNDIYPNRPLWPEDPYQKALDRQLVDLVSNKVNMNFVRATYHVPEGKDRADFVAEYIRKLDLFESELSKRATAFIGGTSPNMADYLLWPFFERWVILPEDFPKDKFPKVCAWCKNMEADPAVVEAATPPEIYKRHYELFLQGINQCDF